MKLSKKLAALCLSLAMLLAWAACSTDTTEENSGDTANDDTATGLKICIITTSGIDDGSFNQNCYEGIQAFLADHPTAPSPT